MSNYRYKLDGEEVILSPEEHMAVQLQIKTGQHAILIMRGGKLGLNTAFMRMFKESNRPTEVQERARMDRPALDAAKATPISPEARQRIHEMTYKSMGWEHGDRCPDYCDKKPI